MSAWTVYFHEEGEKRLPSNRASSQILLYCPITCKPLAEIERVFSASCLSVAIVEMPAVKHVHQQPPAVGLLARRAFLLPRLELDVLLYFCSNSASTENRPRCDHTLSLDDGD